MRRPVFALLASLALASLAELGYRGWLAIRGTPYSQRTAVAKVRAEIEACRLPVGPERDPLGPQRDRNDTPPTDSIPHPYFGWQAPASIEQYNRVTSYFEQAGSEAAFDVVVLGGQVARSVAVQGLDDLRRALSKDARFSDRELRLIYLGHPAFKQPQQVNALTYTLSLGWKPDLVVNVDGHNELALGNANHGLSIHPLNPAAEHWAHLDLSEGSTGEGLDRVLDAYGIRRGMLSELAKLEPPGWRAHLALLSAGIPERVARSAEHFRRQVAAYDELVEPGPSLGVRGPDQPLGRERRLGLIIDQWEDSARMLRAICAAHSIEFLQVVSPSGLDLGAAPPPASLKDIAPAERNAVELGYPVLRERSVDLAAEGLPILDASRLFEGEEGMFIGPDALSAAGLARLCDRIAAAYLEGRAR